MFPGGLATLVEKKSRRMELALYVMSRALESFALCALMFGWVSPRLVPPRPDVLMFTLAAAAILHCYSDANGVHRDVFKSKYLNVLDFILGNTGENLGCKEACSSVLLLPFNFVAVTAGSSGSIT